MKKFLIILLSIVMLTGFYGCGEKTIEIEKITFGFTPKTSQIEVQEFSRNFGNDLKSLLAETGYIVNEVEIVFTSSNEALCQDIENGTIDLGFISPVGFLESEQPHLKPLLVSDTLDCILHDDSLEKINDDREAIEVGKAPGYYGFIYVNTGFPAGEEIYRKAIEKKLRWNDISGLRWNVGSPVSLDTYMMPSLWLNNSFGRGLTSDRKTVAELEDVEGYMGYYDMMYNLITGNCDVMVAYADMRREIRFDEVIYETWGSEYSEMYDFIKIIGVTPMIYNDIIIYNEKNMNAKMSKAVSEALVKIAEPDDSYLRRINIYGFENISTGDLKHMREMVELFNN